MTGGCCTPENRFRFLFFYDSTSPRANISINSYRMRQSIQLWILCWSFVLAAQEVPYIPTMFRGERVRDTENHSDRRPTGTAATAELELCVQLQQQLWFLFLLFIYKWMDESTDEDHSWAGVFHSFQSSEGWKSKCRVFLEHRCARLDLGYTKQTTRWGGKAICVNTCSCRIYMFG